MLVWENRSPTKERGDPCPSVYSSLMIMRWSAKG